MIIPVQSIKNNVLIRALFPALLIVLISSCSKIITTDVLIAGGGTSGVAAGVQAARMGVSTVIVEENEWLGGMLTSAGVSAVDGNYNLQGGIWKEFKDSLAAYYGGDSQLSTGWVSNVLFEPSVGNRIFNNMAAAESLLKISFNSVVEDVKKNDDGWKVKVRTGKKAIFYSAKIVMDATELGDIAGICGVSYDIGMDSRLESGEGIAPERANNIIQDITFVAILKDYGHDVTITKPEGYDSSLFACCCINPLCKDSSANGKLWSCKSMINYGKLPDNKYMINWPASGNDYYLNLIEMDRDKRAEALKAAKNHTMSFIYFMQHELGLNTLGLADDEYPTPDKLPFIPYNRESRRIHGKIRFTINHIVNPYEQPDKLYRTAVAVGDYPVDHHHNKYSGSDTLPDLHFYPVPSYGLPLGVIIPERTEDLIVAEKSISVTNIVNGTTRLQPVVLQIGQAAGALAALAVKQGVMTSEVPVRDVQNTILDAGGYLLPYLDVPNDHKWFKSLQRIGATGIMKGVGKSSGWSNQTFFRASDVTLLSELEGLRDIYPLTDYEFRDEPLTVQKAIDLIHITADQNNIQVKDTAISGALSMIFDGRMQKMDRMILRGEMALLLDTVLDPFNAKEVNIKGDFIK